jgi:hypothetical protein
VEFLGFVASGNGIKPGKIKTEAIENFPIPKNVKEVQSFIGLCNYFRRFVQGFSQIASPLQKLISANCDFVWNSDCQTSFDDLKRKLMEPPILCIFDPSKETELHTDASALGFGAVLLQKQSDAKLHPIAYFSKTTTDSEKKLHSYVLETLAIYYALQRFRIYLEGIEFVLVTDCNSLVQAINKKDMHRSISKSICEFMNYQFTVKHRNGINMGHVDALSRMPMVAAIDPNDIDVQIKALQSIDPVISDLKDLLETQTHEKYELMDGIVFKKRGREIWHSMFLQNWRMKS